MFCCSSLKSPTCGGKGLPPDLSHWSWRWSLGLEEVGTVLHCTQQRRKHCVQEGSHLSSGRSQSLCGSRFCVHWNEERFGKVVKAVSNSRGMSRMVGVCWLCC